MSEQVPSNELFVQARDLLRKIAGETDAARMEVNAWEAMELSRKMRAADEPSAGVKCTHCNGKGYNEPIYDEQDGWTDETPCETCNGSGRITTVEQYLKTLPANWHEDSSLETWFPITAEELKRLKDERAAQPPPASQLEKALQQVMARLADMLDEDKFNNIEAIVREAGVRYPDECPAETKSEIPAAAQSAANSGQCESRKAAQSGTAAGASVETSASRCDACLGDGKIEYGHPNAPEPARVEQCKACDGTGVRR